MRLLVLSRNASLYSTGRLVRAARARGHEVDVIDPARLQFAAVPGCCAVLLGGHPMPPYDAVLPRIGASMTSFGAAAVAELEAAGLCVIGSSSAILLARDKVRSLQLLARSGVMVPRTVGLRALHGLDEALALVGGCPVVVKLQHGTQGVGTMIAESEVSLRSFCEALAAMGQHLVLQEFVREAGGRDVRAFVVGGKVVAAMRRAAAPGEFRSNLHRGGTGEAIALAPAFKRAAVRAAEVLGLEVAGVDLLDVPGRPLVIEVNCSPGLEGIEQATTVDVADAVVAHVERRVARARRRGSSRMPTRSRR
ncbi:MAG: RimK family alpha-L-glutamate ligase [Deltaproteobacteria bacterium]|nr:RimK family alpha-L-glutamate ligase [Deltaproteobacteria bacterium]